MTAYLVNTALLFFWAVLLLWNEPDRAKRRAFCVLASLQWIALSGLRHISVGADTLGYKVYRFDPLLSMSWQDVLRSFWGTYSGPLSVKDPGYLLVVKVLQLISHDYQVFLVVVAVLFTVPLGILIYKRSADPFVSFLIYSCLFSSFFAVTGIRQTIATVLCVLIGYKFIEDRRLIPFLVLSLTAFTIHKSAAAFVPFYFLAEAKFTPRRALALLGVMPAAVLLRAPLVSLFGTMLGYEQYVDQYAGAGAWVFAGALLLTVGVALWRRGPVLAIEPKAAAWYYAVLVGAVLTPAVFVNPNAMRIVQYYSFFLVLLVPATLRSFRDPSERSLAYLVTVSLLVFLFFRTSPQYLFFWQGS